MGPGKGMYIEDMDRWTMWGSILLLLRPWISYDYTVIHVICWVEPLKQRRLCPMLFVKIWILINGTQQFGIGSPEIRRNSVG